MQPGGRFELYQDKHGMMVGYLAGVTDLTFDLKQLKYLSSAGLRVLMALRRP